MIWIDNSFNYIDSIGKFKPFEEEKDDNISYTIDYNEEEKKFRVSRFIDNHWDGDVVFDVFNAHCPICNEDRILTEDIGHCPKCGHHLNKNER